MKVKINDFVKIEFDIFANGKLTQTTDKSKAEKNGLEINPKQSFEPASIIVGKSFILKALDEDIIKEDQGKEKKLSLTPEQAYGKRKKDLIRMLPKSAFEEHKLRPVVGGVYDFNGMYGLVKSISGGRIMVDFNNMLAGKNIDLVYKVVEIIDDMNKKIEIVLADVLKLPAEMYKLNVKDKNVVVEVPEPLAAVGDQVSGSLIEMIPDLKDYKIKIEKFKKD